MPGETVALISSRENWDGYLLAQESHHPMLFPSFKGRRGDQDGQGSTVII